MSRKSGDDQCSSKEIKAHFCNKQDINKVSRNSLTVVDAHIIVVDRVQCGARVGTVNENMKQPCSASTLFPLGLLLVWWVVYTS